MTLYNLRSALDDYRITKFTKDLDVESSYIIGPDERGSIICECPAGTRPTCRHRQMLDDLLPLLDTPFFWDFEKHMAVDSDGAQATLDEIIEYTTIESAPEGVAILDLSDPANLHTTISDAVGEPNLRTTTPAPWRRI